MRCAALALLLVSTTAAADSHLSAGIGLGLTQAAANADADPNHTLGLFGRMKLLGRVSGQVELQRIATQDGSGVDLRSGSTLVVVDLGSKRFVPTAFAGVGLDNKTSAYEDIDYLHAFLGVGGEYRADSGLVIGADFRIGSRASTQPVYKTEPVYDGTTMAGTTAVPRLAPDDLADGEYRAFRITVGVRF